MTVAAVINDELVGRLLDDDPIARRLGAGWTRDYGRLRPGDAGRATLTYIHENAEPVLVEIGGDGSGGNDIDLPGVGRAKCVSFLDDPALPTLRRAFLSASQPRVMRYRPGKRCTYAGRGPDGGAVFLKTFADARCVDIWRNAIVIDQACSVGRFAFRAAAPRWCDPKTNTVAHAALAGIPAAPLLSTGEGPALAARIAHALVSLHLSDVRTAAVFAAADQRRRSAKYARRLAQAAPEIKSGIAAFIDRLDALHERLPDDVLRPVHGAPHPQQWLADGADLGLVDFDRFGRGPVELDAATFVAELDFEALDAAAQDQAVAAFVDVYERRIDDFNRALFAVYRAHKHFAKAFKSALAIRRDRRDRARAILAGAQALLDAESL